MIAATHPWWPHIFDWPRFFDPISWLWLSIKGYAFTSSGEQISIPIAVIIFWRTHNCHQHHCPRLSFHEHPGHGHPVCKKHYQQHPDGNIPGKDYQPVPPGDANARRPDAH